MTTQDRIRAAGGIVHKDGNIFFKNSEQFLAAQVPAGWQLIATAPKGGVAELVTDPAWVEPPIVLLLFAGGVVSTGSWDWHYAKGRRNGIDGYAWVEQTTGEVLSQYYDHPTHWMPLPATPDAAPPAIQRIPEGWQPIETAPKDGTSILLVNNSGVSEGSWHSDMDHGADWEGQIGLAGFCRADGKDQSNTHWMPLPATPNTAPAATQKVPLTGEQIDAALDSIDPSWWDVPEGATKKFARAIEAAHNITPATGTQEAP